MTNGKGPAPPHPWERIMAMDQYENGAVFAARPLSGGDRKALARD